MRALISSIAIAAALLAVALVIGDGDQSGADDCEWCGASDAPAEPGSEAVLAGSDEAGEPLVVTGVVYRPDGATPAAGVLVYAYHTDSTGRYTPSDDPVGNEVRHGRLRGWVRTGDDGRYTFHTVRPAPYPNGREPAHVHLTVTPPGGREAWVDSVKFADDPLLTESERASGAGRGGSGIVELERDGDRLVARRDIVLPEESLEPAN